MGAVTARVLSQGKLLEIPLDEAVAVNDKGAKVWIDLVGRDEETLLRLEQQFDLHPLAVEDCLHAHQRPKLDDYGTHLFLVFYGLGASPDEEDDEEIDVFVSDSMLITVREGHIADIGSALRRLEDCPTDAGTGFLIWALCDEVVDNYFVVVDQVADEIDDLEDAIFSTPRPPDLQARIYGTKKQVIRLRRRITPLRDILVALKSRPKIAVSTVHYLQDVYDHVLRITETIDTFRDLLASVHDAYLTEVSNDLNRVMKRFTSIGAILVTGTIITGIYGMNFEHMPELDWRLGYPLALGTMVAVMVLLLWYFRRKDWL